MIIPTCNRAEYVRDCLMTLRGCGEPGLEVIVVDDGSTDDTEAVVAATDPTARYLRQENSGPATARNRGADHSRGRYVAFLDCDDLWLPGVAPRIVGLLDRHSDVDAVFTEARVGNDRDGYRSWIEVAGQAAFFELPHREPEPGFRVLDPVPFFRRMSRRNAVFIGALIMRREAFERAGRFDVGLCGAADWELWLRMASRMTFGYWPEPLATYTRHDDNMSSCYDHMMAEFCRALEKVLRKCPHLGSAERALLRACRRDLAFGLAYDAYDRGETRLARARFARCLGAATLPALPYYLACCLPPGIVGRFRTFKRELAG